MAPAVCRVSPYCLRGAAGDFGTLDLELVEHPDAIGEASPARSDVSATAMTPAILRVDPRRLWTHRPLSERLLLPPSALQMLSLSGQCLL